MRFLRSSKNRIRENDGDGTRRVRRLETINYGMAPWYDASYFVDPIYLKFSSMTHRRI